jgi:hypothetical protein
MKDIQKTSNDEVEQKLGIPFDRTCIQNLGGVNHYIGDVLDKKGDIVMRFVGVEGAPHYPSAWAGELAWNFLKRFSRDPKSKKIVVKDNDL